MRQLLTWSLATGDVTDPPTAMEVGPAAFEEIDLATGGVGAGVDVGGAVVLDATGRARLVTSLLTVGSHTVSAVYAGNVSYRTSTSANLTQTVSKSNSRTVVVSSGSPVVRNTTVVFTATVTARGSGTGPPTGTVQFRIDGVNTGAPVSLNTSGQATYSTSTLSVGRHTISAVYAGNGSFNASTGGNITQRIL